MKIKLFFWHARLVKLGYFRIASYLLRRMMSAGKDMNGRMIAVTIDISDGNDEAYESGFADWLQKYSYWYNKNRGFSAKLHLQ